MKTFSYTTGWGTSAKGIFILNLQTLQLGIMEEGYPEPWAMPTVKVPGLAPGEYAIKDWSENSGILPALISLKIVSKPVRYVMFHGNQIAVCQINEDVAKQYLYSRERSDT